MSTTFKIGVDVGGVLSVHSANRLDMSAEHTNCAIDMPGAVDNVRALAAAGHELHVVSYCGRARAAETRASLDATVPEIFTSQIYVKNRLSKGAVCRALAADIMIDDNPEVLDCVRRDSPETSTILFGETPSPPHLLVRDWTEVMDMIEILQQTRRVNRRQPTEIPRKLVYN